MTWRNSGAKLTNSGSKLRKIIEVEELKRQLEEQNHGSEATQEKLIKLVNMAMYGRLEGEVISESKKAAMKWNSGMEDVKRILLECRGSGKDGKYKCAKCSRVMWSMLKNKYFDCSMNASHKDNFYRHVGAYHMTSGCVFCGARGDGESAPGGLDIKAGPPLNRSFRRVVFGRNGGKCFPPFVHLP